MDFLRQQNKRNAGDTYRRGCRHFRRGQAWCGLSGARYRSDCIGTSIRQGALSVVQLEILPKPPEKENQTADLAELANKLRTRRRMMKASNTVTGAPTPKA